MSHFSKKKVAYFTLSLLVKFRPKPAAKNKHSFTIYKDQHKIEFHTSKLSFDKIYGLLKEKLNLKGFQERFFDLRILGAGSFATVHLIYDIEYDKYFAAKRITREKIAVQRKGEAALMNEIQILRDLHHPNIIKLDSVYEENDSFNLVFELLSGGNLKDYVRGNGVFSENKAIQIMRAILLGIQYLHSKNIMHRDIKPENILFRSEEDIFGKNQIVIADLGLATRNEVGEYIYARCGTPGYVAPEVYASTDPKKHYSLNSDLFGVGILFFFLLKGTLPYKQESDIFRQNKEMNFNKTEFEKFSPLARDFLNRLLCAVEKRMTVHQALNHEFLNEFEMNIQSERETSLLSLNLLEFNTRKLSMENTNLMTISPCFSPFLQKGKNEMSFSFMTMSPLMNGYIKDQKVRGDEENLRSVANERKEMILINKPVCKKFCHQSLFKELEELEII